MLLTEEVAALVLVRLVLVLVVLVRLVLVLVVLVLVTVAPPAVYSTCRSGAAAGTPSHASATRRPLPVTSTTSALPLVQPGWFTISCTTGASSGVRCTVPAAPTVGHCAMLHGTVASVRGRVDRLRVVVANAAALPVR